MDCITFLDRAAQLLFSSLSNVNKKSHLNQCTRFPVYLDDINKKSHNSHLMSNKRKYNMLRIFQDQEHDELWCDSELPLYLGGDMVSWDILRIIYSRSSYSNILRAMRQCTAWILLNNYQHSNGIFCRNFFSKEVFMYFKSAVKYEQKQWNESFATFIG